MSAESSEKQPILSSEDSHSLIALKQLNEQRNEDNGGNFTDNDHSIGYLATLSLLVKLFIGVGIVGLPVAIKNGGLVGSLLGMIVLSVIMGYSVQVLVRSAHRLYAALPVDRMTYGQVMEQSLLRHRCEKIHFLAIPARLIIDSFIVTSTVGAGTMFVIFIGENIQKLVDETVGPTKNFSLRIYELGLLVLVIPVASVRHLKHFASLSYVANMILLLSLVSAFGYLIYFMVGSSDWRLDEVKLFGNFQGFLTFVSMTMLAFDGIPGVLPIVNKIRSKNDLVRPCGVLNANTIIMTLAYSVTGYLGYLAYGESTRVLTLNLPKSSWLVAVIVGCSVAALISYGTVLFVFTDIVRPVVVDVLACRLIALKQEHVSLVSEYVTRAIYVVTTFCIAIVVPFLEEVIAFFGSFACSPISLIFPTIIHVLMYSDVSSVPADSICSQPTCPLLRRPLFWFDCLVLLFGFVCWTAGTAVAVSGIVESYRPASAAFPCTNWTSLNRSFSCT